MRHDAEPVTVFHNPSCGTSRKVLDALRREGIEPQVVRYLDAGWTRAGLNRVLDALGLKPRDVLRRSEPRAGELLEGGDDEAIFEAMLADPSLVERPIVLTAKGAALCRPADRLRAVL